MRRMIAVGAALVLAVAVIGCQTTRGVHTIPVTRDYQQLEQVDLKETAALVQKAHGVGAQHFAPYEYHTANAYLAIALEEKGESDRPGMWDYAALAKDAASAAVSKGGITEVPPLNMPEDEEACQAEFERLKARYSELDREKAIQVSPVIYANVVSALSEAEHELAEPRHWPSAARVMDGVEANISTIWAQDVDGDGIIDMKDGAPWAPEDKDGFEDSDGIPDPDNDKDGILDLDDVKPMDPETKNRWHDFDGAPDAYPELEAIHFESASHALSNDAKGYLRGIAELVIEWPELKLHLSGHTDNRHTEDYNIKLSQRRAEAVRDYLAANGGPADQLVVTFHGETQPCADNKTAKGMAQNRRTTLTFE